MRYIDADALIAEYDRVHVGAPGGARKLMVDAPTADVVHRSEMSIVVVQNMALENTNVDLKRRLVIAEAVVSVAIGKVSDMVSESKREVAREIFEQVDGITDLLAKGLVGELEFYDMLSELKKKYTEE